MEGPRMGSVRRAIRQELRRFERRRLRPLFRWFRPRRVESHPTAPPARVEPEPPIPAVEELLIALVRAELRRRSSALRDTGSMAEASLATDAPKSPDPTGRTEAEDLVRSLLDAPPTDHEARSEAA